MDSRTRQRLIEEHLDAIRDLETPTEAEPAESWPPNRFYLLWHLVIGMMLGALGALISLLAHILGAPLFGQRSLELIRVYLTFPMGAQALVVEEATVLTVGCVLYLVTGAAYGILFHLVLTMYFAEASIKKRFFVATALGLGLWVFNFYLVLSWLQPLLLGGNWIVSMIPPWVGALTHLVFAWVMVVGEAWGSFDADRGMDSTT